MTQKTLDAIAKREAKLPSRVVVAKPKKPKKPKAKPPENVVVSGG